MLQAPLQTGAGGVLVRALATFALTLASALARSLDSLLAALRSRPHSPAPPSPAGGARASVSLASAACSC